MLRPLSQCTRAILAARIPLVLPPITPFRPLRFFRSLSSPLLGAATATAPTAAEEELLAGGGGGVRGGGCAQLPTSHWVAHPPLTHRRARCTQKRRRTCAVRSAWTRFVARPAGGQAGHAVGLVLSPLSHCSSSRPVLAAGALDPARGAGDPQARWQGVVVSGVGGSGTLAAPFSCTLPSRPVLPSPHLTSSPQYDRHCALFPNSRTLSHTHGVRIHHDGNASHTRGRCCRGCTVVLTHALPPVLPACIPPPPRPRPPPPSPARARCATLPSHAHTRVGAVRGIAIRSCQQW